MSDNKRDLTRIEDLGEYLHELNEENNSSFENPELPELPSDEGSFLSDSTDSSPSDSPSFEISEDSNLSSEESTFATSEETIDFGSNDFGSSSESETTDFSTSDETPFTLTEEESFFPSDKTDMSAPTESSFTPENEEHSLFNEALPEEDEISETSTVSVENTYKAPENFSDLKKFAENSSVTGMGAEGNPSFSVLLKNVRYIEDVNDILTMMKELGLLADSEEQMKQRLMRGHLLVPRISEFSAIFLAHKLRRFDIDIQVGLSDEIHPPKHQEAPETGLVSKSSLYQNQTHHFHFDDPKLEISQIIISATPNLEGHQVIRYLGVASEHKMLEGHIVEDESSSEVPRHYTELAHKLKAHALKANANAVIGLNYQLTPLPSEYGINSSKYRLSCTGNLVWVNKL